MKKKLTPKQEKFCREYIRTGNASEAYRRAYNAGKMKPETVNRKAVELMENGKVSAMIEHLQHVAKKRWEVSIGDLIVTLSKIAKFDPKDIYDDDWNVKPLSEIPEEARLAIASVKRKKVDGPMASEDTIEVRTADKLAAIEKLMKHLGGYERDNAQKVTQITVKVEE